MRKSFRLGCAAALCLTTVHCGDMGDSERVPAQGAAFEQVRSYLAKAFPTYPIVEPDVRWWRKPCPGTLKTAVVLRGVCYSGLYYRPDGVDVAWRGSIGQSAYTHELMHYLLDQTSGDPDAGHALGDMWELVSQADLHLQRLGM